ncbi:hypothetical protein FGO68_gene165 [Halteria grandinella]|uniref:Uncharacterized protein n=1 Tax=Halteria grandinella TaxID=5974 RepID=A0A8J8ND49_HALGN|nr:hypothetical protein FGO68_gene165 [Halteria grandinella]
MIQVRFGFFFQCFVIHVALFHAFETRGFVGVFRGGLEGEGGILGDFEVQGALGSRGDLGGKLEKDWISGENLTDCSVGWALSLKQFVLFFVALNRPCSSCSFASASSYFSLAILSLSDSIIFLPIIVSSLRN